MRLSRIRAKAIEALLEDASYSYTSCTMREYAEDYLKMAFEDGYRQGVLDYRNILDILEIGDDE
jgi:hypothetical protein